jgi:putative SOS response-associated peptidase YedK
MCGRFVITSSPDAIRRLFGYAETPNFPPRYNVAPTQPIPTVMLSHGARHFQLMRWGLIPTWAKDPAKVGLLINARCETLNERPAFRNAMRYRRCLVPADGYYEWPERGPGKRPLYIYPAQGGPIGFAGLAETWTGPNGEEVDTVAIVTTPAAKDIAHFHPRMPAIISPDAFDLWLNCREADAETASSLLLPARVGALRYHEVTSAVNRHANDDASLIAPISDEQRAAEDAPPAKPARKPKPAAKQADDDQGSLF